MEEINLRQINKTVMKVDQVKDAVQDLSQQALFQQQWQIYSKVLDHNYFFHHEVGDHLRAVILEQARSSYTFLDIACGDARASVEALRGTSIAQYIGIDLSVPALERARPVVEGLDCPFTLEHADFVDALGQWSTPVDVAWMGLSLHHLTAPGKREVLRMINGAIKPDGLLMIYDNTVPDGGDRDDWLATWDSMRSIWTAFTDEEWSSISAHVHAADYPESQAAWFDLGSDAGFSVVREIYRMPGDLFRMYVFTP